MTSPLSPEALAQLVADLTESDKPLLAGVIPFAETRLRIRKAADMLTTLAAENATLRAENHVAIMQRAEVVERLMDDIATLRASEAAALERVTRMEAALQFYSDISGWNQPQVKTRDGLISVEYENQASKIQRDRGKIARAALTPTADKEPK